MVKFIFEVSEDFIHEKAGVESIEQTAGKDGGNVIKALVQLVAMGDIERKLKEGRTEFIISRDNLKDNDAAKLYDNTLCDVAFLAHFAEEKKDAVQEGK